MEKYLEDFNGLISSQRNPTELSRFAEALIVTFLRNGASSASVRHADTPYEFETLYKGLYNISRKNDYKRLVKVHKQDGRIILLRGRT